MKNDSDVSTCLEDVGVGNSWYVTYILTGWKYHPPIMRARETLRPLASDSSASRLWLHPFVPSYLRLSSY